MAFTCCSRRFGPGGGPALFDVVTAQVLRSADVNGHGRTLIRFAVGALRVNQRRKSENLRQALVVLGLNATLTLAVSIGCATHGAQTLFGHVAEFVNAGSQALYTSKLRGRNRSVPFDRQRSGSLARMG